MKGIVFNHTNDATLALSTKDVVVREPVAHDVHRLRQHVRDSQRARRIVPHALRDHLVCHAMQDLRGQFKLLLRALLRLGLRLRLGVRLGVRRLLRHRGRFPTGGSPQPLQLETCANGKI